MTERVLVIYPHPDDEGFSCAGTVSSYTSRGVPVTYICLTLGEMGRNMGSPIFANRESLYDFRKKELKKAADAIGIEDLRLWGLWDKTVEFENLDELSDRIKNAILEIRPSLIITFYPGYSVHPDHDACGAAVVEAVKKLPVNERPVLRCVAFAKNSVTDLGEPDTVIDVSNYIEQKIQALKAHESQFGTLIKGMEPLLRKKDRAVVERLTKERFWTYKF